MREDWAQEPDAFLDMAREQELACGVSLEDERTLGWSRPGAREERVRCFRAVSRLHESFGVSHVELEVVRSALDGEREELGRLVERERRGGPLGGDGRVVACLVDH